jgi:hypothetical protein
MKKNIFLIFLTSVLLFSNCTASLVSNEDNDQGSYGLEVDIIRLELNRNEIATLGDQEIELILTIVPFFATRNQVIWEIRQPDNPDFIELDQNGRFITMEVDDPREAVIRVSSVRDPSIYAECNVTVFPDYGSNRFWNFAVSGWYAERRDTPVSGRTPIVWVNGTTSDINIGMGLTIRGGTGGGGTYTQATETPNGLPIENGAIPSDVENPLLYPPYPWVYIIDPENPYVMGFDPGSRGSRSSINMVAESGGNNTTGTDFYPEWLTTGGAARIMSIAAIKGPFYIEVRYQTNSSGSARWADIRIGDREGLRIQGEPSTLTGGAESGKKVYYFYEGDDIVPFVHIEGAQGGAFRIHEVIISTTPP